MKRTIKTAFQTVADGVIRIQGDDASDKPGLGTGTVDALAAQLSVTVEVTEADPGCGC